MAFVKWLDGGEEMLRQRPDMGQSPILASRLAATPFGWLGATCPAEVAKFAPPFCQGWDGLSDAEKEDAITEAAVIRDQYEQTLAYWKSETGICNATQAGRLANILRAHLIDKGGDAGKLSEDGEAFGSSGDMAEWKRVFGSGPTKAQAKQAFGTPWASPYGGVSVNLDTVCPSGVTLPTKAGVVVTPPPVGPPPPVGKAAPKKKGWGVLALGAALLGSLWYATR